MKSESLDSILIRDLMNNSPMIYHKMMQVSTFSYLEKKHNPYFVRGEFRLPYCREEEGKSIEDFWEADLAIKYDENGKSIYEIVEIETVHITDVGRRLYNIRKKADIVEKILDYKDQEHHNSEKHRHFHTHMKNVDEIRFSVAIDGKYMQQPYLNNSIDWAKQRLKDVSIKGAKIHNLYILTDNLYDHCPDNGDKVVLMNYNASMKNFWKTPMLNTLNTLYRRFSTDNSGIESIYIDTPMKSPYKKPI